MATKRGDSKGIDGWGFIGHIGMRYDYTEPEHTDSNRPKLAAAAVKLAWP